VQQLRRHLIDLDRVRGDRAERQTRVCNRAILVKAQSCRYPQDGKIERTAPPQLQVRAPPAGSLGQENLGQQCVLFHRLRVHPIVAEQLAHGQQARSALAHQLHLRAPGLTSTGAVSAEEIARQRGLPGATRHTSPSFFMQ